MTRSMCWKRRVESFAIKFSVMYHGTPGIERSQSTIRRMCSPTLSAERKRRDSLGQRNPRLHGACRWQGEGRKRKRRLRSQKSKEKRRRRRRRRARPGDIEEFGGDVMAAVGVVDPNATDTQTRRHRSLRALQTHTDDVITHSLGGRSGRG
jgi:hypothetical protein